MGRGDEDERAVDPASSVDVAEEDEEAIRAKLLEAGWDKRRMLKSKNKDEDKDATSVTSKSRDDREDREKRSRQERDSDDRRESTRERKSSRSSRSHRSRSRSHRRDRDRDRDRDHERRSGRSSRRKTSSRHRSRSRSRSRSASESRSSRKRHASTKRRTSSKSRSRSTSRTKESSSKRARHSSRSPSESSSRKPSESARHGDKKADRRDEDHGKLEHGEPTAEEKDGKKETLEHGEKNGKENGEDDKSNDRNGSASHKKSRKSSRRSRSRSASRSSRHRRHRSYSKSRSASRSRRSRRSSRSRSRSRDRRSRDRRRHGRSRSRSDSRRRHRSSSRGKSRRDGNSSPQPHEHPSSAAGSAAGVPQASVNPSITQLMQQYPTLSLQEIIAKMQAANVTAAAAASLKPARELYVGNLPPNITGAQLQEFLGTIIQQVGLSIQPGNPIMNTWISTDGHFAFCEMRTVEECNLALLLNQLSLLGQPLKFGRPRSFMGPLQPVPVVSARTQTALVNLGCTPNPAWFSSSGSAIPGMDVTGASSVAASTLAAAAIPGIGDTSGIAPITPAVAVPQESGLPNKLVMDNIPIVLTEDQVKELVEPFGSLRAFTLVKDASTGASTGTALFEYQDESVTDEAVSGLNGLDIGGIPLSVHREVSSTTTANSLEQPSPALKMVRRSCLDLPC